MAMIQNRLLEFRIRKPNDSGENWEVSGELQSIGKDYSLLHKVGRTRYTATPNRQAKDPVLGGITEMFRQMLQVKRRRRRSYRTGPNEFKGILKIKGLPIMLTKTNIRYELNGKPQSLETVCNVLARVLFKATTTDDTNALMKALYSYLDMPEQVRYAIENKVPYHFFHEFDKHEVRLNIQQIDNDEYAIEVSDGVWGTMTTKDLVVFVNTYLHGKKRGNWYQISPQMLYERTVGKKPSESDVKVMREFLKQNRTSDIVEKRARDLVKEMEIQYGDKIEVRWDENEMPEKIFVRGKQYDWLLTSRGYKQNYQMVSTFIWQPKYNKLIEGASEEEKAPKWQGPICIDNMNSDSSLGDQFAARVLAFINDDMTTKIVNTIKSRITTEPNECRVDKNDVSRMWNEGV
tara:strand:+ start:2173 stop:3384 length:1212 start_codon:yes stop_codon:yes gene_type:complete